MVCPSMRELGIAVENFQVPTALPPRFRRHQVVRAVVDHQLAKVLGAVLDGGDPDVGIVDQIVGPVGFEPTTNGL